METTFEIRMDHPARNALSEELVAWLEERLAEAGDGPILLTGSEDAFCAGVDLRQASGFDRDAMEAFLRRLDSVAARLFDHPAPTVAAVNGHAIAGGCILAQCCDLRVATASASARIGLNELAIGACFPPAILRILKHRLPSRHLRRALLEASLVPPSRALELGYVDELADDPLAVARERIAALASHPRATYALTKRTLQNGVTTLDPADERRFVDEEIPLWISDDTRARMASVLAR